MSAREAGDIVLERFRLDKPLASGAMGEVWSATATDTGDVVAVKLARGDGAARTHREADALQRLQHPGVVGFVAAGEEADTEVVVMELLDGVPLAKHLSGTGPDVPESLDLAAQLADALVHAHERGVVHRDVKASNTIVVQPRGERPRAVLIDFGLSLMEGSARISSADVVLGSTHTMPPEQVQGLTAGPAADVYSLGALTFRMVCGRYPFHASSQVQVLAMHAHAKVPTFAQRARRRVSVPRGLEALVQQMLAKSPDDRPSAREVADRLGALNAVPQGRWVEVEPEQAASESETRPPVPAPGKARLPVAVGASAGALALLLVVAAAWWFAGG